jgi:hypothetical protein
MMQHHHPLFGLFASVFSKTVSLLAVCGMMVATPVLGQDAAKPRPRHIDVPIERVGATDLSRVPIATNVARFTAVRVKIPLVDETGSVRLFLNYRQDRDGRRSADITDLQDEEVIHIGSGAHVMARVVTNDVSRLQAQIDELRTQLDDATQRLNALARSPR